MSIPVKQDGRKGKKNDIITFCTDLNESTILSMQQTIQRSKNGPLGSDLTGVFSRLWFIASQHWKNWNKRPFHWPLATLSNAMHFQILRLHSGDLLHSEIMQMNSVKMETLNQSYVEAINKAHYPLVNNVPITAALSCCMSCNRSEWSGDIQQCTVDTCWRGRYRWWKLQLLLSSQ